MSEETLDKKLFRAMYIDSPPDVAHLGVRIVIADWIEKNFNLSQDVVAKLRERDL